MENEELYSLVKKETEKTGITISEKALEELSELTTEVDCATYWIQKGEAVENILSLADEIADVTIMMDQVTEKDFWKLVCNRRAFKLERLEQRVLEGNLF